METKISASKTEVIVNNYLQGVLKEVMSVLRAECGSIFLFDAGKKELILNAFYDSHESNIAHHQRQKIGEGVAGKVADIKKPVLVKDINSDGRFQHNGFKHYHTDSFMSIPLFGPSGLLGIMNISDKSNREPFSEKDLAFLVTLCRYACIIADNLASSERLLQEKVTFDAQKRLLEKYASVGKLAAGIVHEVNNPLDGIIRYTNMLITHINDDTVEREYLLEIKKGLNRIAKTTKSLLEFSHQVNAGLPNKVKSYINVHEIIHEAVDVFKNKLTVSNIQVDTKFDASIPRIADLGLSHVCMNIIKNAIDAMPKGGKLEISTGLKDSSLFLRFRDSGGGIPQDVMEHIFEPFFTTKAIDKGTGLGLAIANEIINKYGGSIGIESQLNKGTEFTVTIPAENLEHA